MSDETNPAPAGWWAGLKHNVSEWVAERDMILMVLLGGFLFGGMAGTIGGAAKLFPYDIAVVVGVAISMMLFALESGAAGRHAPVKRWIAILALSAVSVYAQIFLYYSALGSDRDAMNGMDRAAQLHAELVDTVYAPRKNEARRFQELADAKYKQAEDEAKAGGLTGAVGYGPRARELRQQGNDYATQAAELSATIADLKDFAEFDPAAVGPEVTYERDLKLWQSAPPEWKSGTAMPEREQYIDLTMELGLLMPLKRLANWDEKGVWAPDEVALSALAIALFIDGSALFLGLAIERRAPKKKDERPASQRIAAGVVGAKQTWNTVKQAWSSPAGHEDVQDPLRILQVRVEGKNNAEQFFSEVYAAIDPETGELDYSRLQSSDDPSIRSSARWLMDAWRGPGWLSNAADGMWVVPADHYLGVTSWLREHILKELDHRDGEARRKHVAKTKNKPEPEQPDGLPIERRLRLVLPPPVKQAPGAEVRLMRHRAKNAAEAASEAVAISSVPGAPVVVQPVVVARPRPAPVTTPVALAATTSAVVAASRPVVVEQRRATLVPEEDDVATIHDAPEMLRERRVVSSAPVAVEAVAPEVEAVPVEVEADDPTPMGLNPVALDRVAAELERVRREMERDLEEPTEPSMIARSADLPTVPLHEHSDEPPTDLIRAPEPDEEEPTGEVPVPSRADPPTPLAPWVPDFTEENWADRPTGSTVVTGRPRERGESGLVLRDDALRHGRIVSLTYRTQPPRLMGADLTSPHAPRIRAALRELAPGGAK